MCGIFAVLRDPTTSDLPSLSVLESLVDAAQQSALSGEPVSGFTQAAGQLESLNEQLKGTSGVRLLLSAPDFADRLTAVVGEIDARIGQVESSLDAGELGPTVSLEALNSALVALKDATWAIGRDRLRTASCVGELAAVGRGEVPSASSIDAYTSIQLALSAIDRLEVRGRDSAGIGVLVDGFGQLDVEFETQLAAREDPLFLSGAVHRSGETVAFVYKAAAEIGALGDNVKTLRAEITNDVLLRRLVSTPGTEVSIVSHTRWASVGTVSEPNAHPIDSTEVHRAGSCYVMSALNGDVDNYAALKAANSLEVADEITTDAKVIPVLVGRRVDNGEELVSAFRSTVDEFVGSVAIVSATAQEPERILLAVKGSGQGCYVGFAKGAFLVASEPYGLVEECSSYIRMDGETASPISGKSGQVVELRRQGAGTLSALRRFSYGGEELPVAENELVSPEVTTRDIDRGSAPHFLLKEISESPQSVRRTTRGKISEQNGRLSVTLAEEALPTAIREALKAGTLRQVISIGQGTAAIAARTVVTMLERVAPGAIAVSTRPATELSGFGLRDDMSDTLVIAVSQSGTTTDTNRTVDLVRSRGAKVIAIVNRRQSDLTDKSDGVFYTSDGRDIEMSVASTKAFYAQVTAASLLALAIAQTIGDYDRQEAEGLLKAFRALPTAMQTVLERRPSISAAARTYAPSKKSWAIVGNGPNFIAAQELRIKLSELCYKSIASDNTEDKKHIDLSAEPMILVCAAGLSGATAADVAKEVAIYRAHKATAIVIASEGATFDAAMATISVPAVHPVIDFVLSTMAGHIFGYEAALAIDSQSHMVRAVRAALDDAASLHASDDDELLAHVRAALYLPSQAVLAALRSGSLDGHLEPSTAVNMVSLLRYATGILPLDSLEIEMGRPVSPQDMLSDLAAALSRAIDELTRPIDAVKHQAKTVTVGISRTEDTFADSEFVQEVINAGAIRDRLSYRSLRMLAALGPAVDEVVGYTRYEVDGDVTDDDASIRVVDRGGVSTGITSRADVDPRLTGTKHRAAYERMVTVGRGQRDGRPFVIVPEMKDQQVTGITLVHVKFAESLSAETAKGVLTGYRNRYSALVDAVTETESSFDDHVLSTLPILTLLVEPVWILAQQWRSNPQGTGS